MDMFIWLSIIVISVTVPSLEAVCVSFNVKGIVSPVFTPVNDDSSLKLDVIKPYAQFLKDKGVDGVLVAGTAGEGPTLNVTDKKALLDEWLEVAGELGLTVIMQVGGIPLPDAQELAAYSEKAGVDAILALPELYYKPKTADELVYFLQFIADSAPKTAILYYHIPSLTGVEVDMVEFFEKATKKIPTFKGLKSEVFEDSLKIQDLPTGNQRIFIADSTFIAPAVLSGFNNFIMTEINLFPQLMIDIVTNGQKGDLNKTRSLNKKLQALRDAIIVDEDSPRPAVKEAMPIVTGIDVGPIRPPQMPLTSDEIEDLEERLEEEGYDFDD